MHILNKILSWNTSYQTWLKVLKCISQYWIQPAITVIIEDISLVFMYAHVSYACYRDIVFLKMILTLMLSFSVDLSSVSPKYLTSEAK